MEAIVVIIAWVVSGAISGVVWFYTLYNKEKHNTVGSLVGAILLHSLAGAVSFAALALFLVVLGLTHGVDYIEDQLKKLDRRIR